MLFWGWGGKSMQRALSPDHVLVLTYRYFHLMFAFTASWGYGYQLATQTPEGWAYRPVTNEDAVHMLGGEELRPSLWRQYSIVLLPVVVLLIVVVGAVFGS